MSKRKIFLARHGETELNRLQIVQGSGVDPALNEYGHQQAAALYEHFRGRVDLVVSSGMVRAEQTVAQFRADGVAGYIDERFREICWGVHEGKVATPTSRQEYAELIADWEAGKLDARLLGGESARELGERLWAGWLSLLQKPFDAALVCMHGRALRALTCLLDDQPLSKMSSYEHANAGYYTLEYVEPKWVFDRTLQIAHLTELNALKQLP